jgi:hypothetical protein
VKRVFFTCLIVLISSIGCAQSHFLDSLHSLVNNAKEDTAKVSALNELAVHYCFNQFDSSIFYAQQIIGLSKKLDYPYGSFLGLRSLFFAYNCQGNYTKALEVTFQNVQIAEKIRKERPAAFTSVRYFLGVLNREMGNFNIAISQLHESIRSNTMVAATMFPAYAHLALAYMAMNQPDSALWCAQKANDLSQQPNVWYQFRCFPLAVLGEIHNNLGHFQVAKKYFFSGVEQSELYGNYFFLARNYSDLSNLFYETGYQDSCIYYAGVSLQLCLEHKFNDYALNASSLLTKVYESKNKPDSTYKYMKIMLALRDSVFGQSRVKEFQKYIFDEEQRKQETANQQEKYKNRIKITGLVVGMIGLLIMTVIVLRNITLKRKNESHRRVIAESELQLQKLESERTRAELQQEATELEMQALRAQMNPHFIFNSLSSINHFILKNNSELASEYLTKFSRLIRMVLNNSKNALITLEDELEMLRLYLDLERLRFNNSFDYTIHYYNRFDISSTFIPPLLLQPFAENAIWHGLTNKKGQGILEFAFELDHGVLSCYITDNGIGREKAGTFKSRSAENQKSMGMQITADRLALFNNDVGQTIFSIEDLVDTQGEAAGTRVTLKIKYKATDEKGL